MPTTPPPDGAETARRAVADLDRDSLTRILATLARRFGDLGLAEDVLQEALAQALISWPETGVPRAPSAWVMTCAKRKALDAVRRDAVLAQKLAQLRLESERLPTPSGFADPAEAPPQSPVPDERLGMFFACTHPALKAEDRVALTLRFVAGMSTAEVAHALLLPVTTCQQRIVRAKKRIRGLVIPFEPPAAADLPARLPGVLRVIYLLYSEGFARSTGADHVRDDLTAEAVRLARLLQRLLPEPETTGLLGLLLLTEARRPARLDGDGRPVPLVDQDRGAWDPALIAEGTSLVERAAAATGAGPYTIQAAIAAVHAEAATADETDWEQIAVLYRLLEERERGPVVRLGRAIAVGRAYGPSLGLRRLDQLATEPALAGFRPYHVARALTLAELGDADAAAAAYRDALALPGNDAEDDYLASTLAGLTDHR
ncbi:RNA polymerase sigma factor [Tsukamurella sp. PLM1]|uniref:RNA polymerase sigma factor n=1 Tax=Tsukamurella sp. PLM1 TaxID=2929795 RepID=UPI00205E046C|nr:DUF6596 domain-containing protein [Tsukamurella sp. PLM1]BDH56499.1 RNA polymerase subunit sigma-24 [Tsukamurella sp. PLM1]